MNNDALMIERVVRDWALWRDTRQWDALRTCYAPGARLRTTWMVGTADEFIAASIRSAANPDSPLAQHALGGTSVRVAGLRALAETRMTIMLRTRVHDVEVDITAWGRFVDWFVQHHGRWCILERYPIHEKDRMDPVNPEAVLNLDAQRLASLPRAYRHITYAQSLAGAVITTDLIEHNSPEQTALYAESDAWLQQG